MANPSALPASSPAACALRQLLDVRNVLHFDGYQQLLQALIDHAIRVRQNRAVTVAEVEEIFAAQGCGADRLTQAALAGEKKDAGASSSSSSSASSSSSSSSTSSEPLRRGTIVEAWHPTDKAWRTGVVVGMKKDWRGRPSSYTVAYGERESDWRPTLKTKKWLKNKWIHWTVEPTKIRSGAAILPEQPLWRGDFAQFEVDDGIFEVESTKEIVSLGNRLGWGLGAVTGEPEAEAEEEEEQEKGGEEEEEEEDNSALEDLMAELAEVGQVTAGGQGRCRFDDLFAALHRRDRFANLCAILFSLLELPADPEDGTGQPELDLLGAPAYPANVRGASADDPADPSLSGPLGQLTRDEAAAMLDCGLLTMEEYRSVVYGSRGGDEAAALEKIGTYELTWAPSLTTAAGDLIVNPRARHAEQQLCLSMTPEAAQAAETLEEAKAAEHAAEVAAMQGEEAAAAATATGEGEGGGEGDGEGEGEDKAEDKTADGDGEAAADGAVSTEEAARALREALLQPVPQAVGASRECLGPLAETAEAYAAAVAAIRKERKEREKAMAAAAAAGVEYKGDGAGGAEDDESKDDGLLQAQPKLSIVVQFVGKGIITLKNVLRTNLVIEVKRKVEKKTASAQTKGIHPRDQIFFFRGKQLDNQSSLGQAGITNEALVYLVVRGTVVQAWYNGDDFDNPSIKPNWIAGKVSERASERVLLGGAVPVLV